MRSLLSLTPVLHSYVDTRHYEMETEELTSVLPA